MDVMKDARVRATVWRVAVELDPFDGDLKPIAVPDMDMKFGPEVGMRVAVRQRGGDTFLMHVDMEDGSQLVLASDQRLYRITSVGEPYEAVMEADPIPPPVTDVGNDPVLERIDRIGDTLEKIADALDRIALRRGSR